MKEVSVESVSSPGCSHCELFEEFWHSIEGDFPNVKYKNVSILTPEGTERAGKHGIFVSPGIIINGELFSTGGVNKEKFIQRLKELSA